MGLSFSALREAFEKRTHSITVLEKATQNKTMRRIMGLRPAGDDIALDLVYEAFRSVATAELPELSPDWEIADLGYDSVQILEALTHIEESVDVALAQQDLIGVRTIGDLADVVRSSLAGSPNALAG